MVWLIKCCRLVVLVISLWYIKKRIRDSHGPSLITRNILKTGIRIIQVYILLIKINKNGALLNTKYIFSHTSHLNSCV